MGHLIFCILHLIALIFGFVGLFLTIPLHLIYSAANRPKGPREDGKRRTGGILGGVVDDIVVGCKMANCPYCKERILKDAVKCKHCGEFLHNKNDCEKERDSTQIMKKCEKCGTMNPDGESFCSECGLLLKR